jgi:hypothetical protein
VIWVGAWGALLWRTVSSWELLLRVHHHQVYQMKEAEEGRSMETQTYRVGLP